MHGFLIRGLLAAGVFAWLSHEIVPPLQVLLCLACGALIAALFSTRFMDKLATPLTRPVRWLTPAGRTLARIRPRGWWAPARPSLAGRSPPRSQRTNRKHDASAIRRRME
jgi:hypothetical protein